MERDVEMRTYGDEILRELKRKKVKELFTAKNTTRERIKLLEELLIELNITKSSMAELDRQYPNMSIYLCSVIQSDFEVDMNLCPFYKMWYNEKGEQRRCSFNTGPKQIGCYGSYKRCEHTAQYLERICETINGKK